MTDHFLNNLALETKCIHPTQVSSAKSIHMDPSVVPSIHVSVNFDRNLHSHLDTLPTLQENTNFLKEKALEDDNIDTAKSQSQHIYSRESTPLRDLVESMIAGTEGPGLSE